MVKTLNLPDAVYGDLCQVSKELTALAGKTISLSMTVYLLTEIYRAHIRDPCSRDHFRNHLANSNIMSPEEFETKWDKPQEKF